MDFLITGYPRSGTAWCSVFFTYGPVFCFHEAIKWGNMLPHQPVYIGDACPSILLEAEKYPDVPLVLIKRKLTDVFDSMDKIFNSSLSTKVIKEVMPKMDIVARQDRTLVVEFEDMFEDIETLQKMWEHCVPEVAFDEDRARVLQHLRVTTRIDKDLKLYKRD